VLFCYIKEAQKSRVCCRTKSCVQCWCSIVFQVSREFQYTVSSSESRLSVVRADKIKLLPAGGRSTRDGKEQVRSLCARCRRWPTGRFCFCTTRKRATSSTAWILLSSGQDETTLACFPRPIARFPLLPWASSFAVSGGSILGVNYNWANTRVDDAVMRVGEHKFWERLTSRPIRDALIPWLPTGLLRPINAPGSFGSHKGAPAMLPVGDAPRRSDFSPTAVVGMSRPFPSHRWGTWHKTKSR
jgi:hypothetical protein